MGKVVGKRLIGGRRIVISVPSGVIEMEMDRITTSLFETGARRTQLIDRPIAAAIGEDPSTIEDVYEPYLMQIGYLSRTPRGRTVTPAGYRHLGLEYPVK